MTSDFSQKNYNNEWISRTMKEINYSLIFTFKNKNEDSNDDFFFFN